MRVKLANIMQVFGSDRESLVLRSLKYQHSKRLGSNSCAITMCQRWERIHKIIQIWLCLSFCIVGDFE